MSLIIVKSRSTQGETVYCWILGDSKKSTTQVLTGFYNFEYFWSFSAYLQEYSFVQKCLHIGQSHLQIVPLISLACQGGCTVCHLTIHCLQWYMGHMLSMTLLSRTFVNCRIKIHRTLTLSLWLGFQVQYNQGFHIIINIKGLIWKYPWFRYTQYASVLNGWTGRSAVWACTQVEVSLIPPFPGLLGRSALVQMRLWWSCSNRRCQAFTDPVWLPMPIHPSNFQPFTQSR